MNYSDYTIRRGDTLSQIARQYNTTVGKLAKANEIENVNSIRAGATLRIPHGDNAYETAEAGSVSAHINAAIFPDQYTQSTASVADTSSFSNALNAATALQSTGSASNALAGRQLVDLSNHQSGYKGMGYYDERGRAFTEYGAYLRTDNFFYPAGARISKNGMYFDDGSGWKYAKYYKQTNDDGSVTFMPSDIYGLAPGTYLNFGLRK